MKTHLNSLKISTLFLFALTVLTTVLPIKVKAENTNGNNNTDLTKPFCAKCRAGANGRETEDALDKDLINGKTSKKENAALKAGNF